MGDLFGALNRSWVGIDSVARRTDDWGRSSI